jgi:hypothetical protein
MSVCNLQLTNNINLITYLIQNEITVEKQAIYNLNTLS